jgi:RimJ/RimL family protein N-acetyltransferase
MMDRILLKDGQELTIRPAEADDAKRIVDYGNIVGGESNGLAYGRNEFPITLKNLKKQLSAMKNSRDGITIIGEVQDALVGVAGIFTSPGKRGHIGELSISVRRAWWNHGVGSALLRYIIEWAQATQKIRKV